MSADMQSGLTFRAEIRRGMVAELLDADGRVLCKLIAKKGAFVGDTHESGTAMFVRVNGVVLPIGEAQ